MASMVSHDSHATTSWVARPTTLSIPVDTKSDTVGDGDGDCGVYVCVCVCFGGGDGDGDGSGDNDGQIVMVPEIMMGRW